MSLFAGRELVCVRGERTVFAGLDFALDAGEALVLTGPNGSGKSSLLRLMAGLLRPARGALTWDGAPISADREAHCARLHYVGHLDAIKPALSVRENLRFWAGLANGPGAGDPGPALAGFGLEPLADIPARMLSAGQRRRLALARLLAAPAPLWLLDEPTVALDAESVGRLEAAVATHRADGGIVVLATHAGIALEPAQELHIARHAPGAGEPAEAETAL